MAISGSEPTGPIKLVLIKAPLPGSAGVLRPLFDDRPVLRGPGNIAYVCASCTAILMDGVSERQAGTFSIRCGRCGAFNALRAEFSDPI
jgi:DNA-directed RNA polymerase subunit RPC12/RpoP